MKRLDEANITPEAQARLEATPDARMKEIMVALTRHLHEFAREVRLTPHEWMTGIEFLTKVGQISDENRQEFILLSDTLGLSALVDMMAHGNGNQGATASSLLGPFYRKDVTDKKNGETIANTPDGEPLAVHGRVSGSDGEPIANAIVDV